MVSWITLSNHSFTRVFKMRDNYYSQSRPQNFVKRYLRNWWLYKMDIFRWETFPSVWEIVLYFYPVVSSHHCRLVGRTDIRSNGRTDIRTNGRTYGRMDGHTDEWTDIRTNGRTDIRTNGRTDIQTNGRTYGRMDRRTYGRMDGVTNGRTQIL